MELYDHIAEHFDEIFPLNEKKIDFILDFTEDKPKKTHILDVGAATGALATELAKIGYKIIASDINPRIVEVARRRDTEARFIVLDMTKMKEHFKKKKFDMIFCMGNSLPHLKNRAEVIDFLKQAYDLLDDSGCLILQMINFRKEIKFPVIETDNLVFNREYIKELNSLIFRTKLFLKNDNKAFEDDTELYPIVKEELKKLLEKAGFNDMDFYSDFSKMPFKDNSDMLIVKADKS